MWVVGAAHTRGGSSGKPDHHADQGTSATQPDLGDGPQPPPRRYAPDRGWPSGRAPRQAPDKCRVTRAACLFRVKHRLVGTFFHRTAICDAPKHVRRWHMSLKRMWCQRGRSLEIDDISMGKRSMRDSPSSAPRRCGSESQIRAGPGRAGPGYTCGTRPHRRAAPIGRRSRIRVVWATPLPCGVRGGAGCGAGYGGGWGVGRGGARRGVLRQRGAGRGQRQRRQRSSSSRRSPPPASEQHQHGSKRNERRANGYKIRRTGCATQKCSSERQDTNWRRNRRAHATDG